MADKIQHGTARLSDVHDYAEGTGRALSSALTGNLGAVAYALAGGLLSLGGMCLLKPLLTDRQLFVGSVIGAMLHNLGQLTVAVWISQTPGIFGYLPVLLLSGMVTGLFTGIAAQAVLRRLK
ncbi:MAG: Gx transporter family protein [Oscillospiraceae bacterium]|nr:Gx transporter family protein [Oscillospiraceae bacterium]